MINMLCIRDPDHGNEYVADGEIREITIDIGGSWVDYKHFSRELAEGADEALAYEQSLLADVSDLDEDNPVRKAVVDYFDQARQMGVR